MNAKKNARPSWNLGRANKRSAYLLYSKNPNLSSDLREIAAYAVGVSCFAIDIVSLPCFVALVCGVSLWGHRFALAMFFAAQIAAVAVVAACELAKAIRRMRRPKRLGIISAEDIRRMMEVRGR